MKFKIGKILIGEGSKCFIVAELSGNHNGRLDIAKKLILEAKKSGADAVKLQTYKPDTITLKSNKKDFTIANTPWKNEKNYWSLYKKAHTPWDWHKKLFLYAKKIDIEIFSSPFDESAVDLLENLGCKAYKIASAEINHIPLIKKIALTKKPIIFSIGLAELKDIYLAIKTIKKCGNNKIAILQCDASYPSLISNQNLKTMIDIKKRFKTLVGFSDHTIGNTAALASVALGSNILEKHFMLDTNKKSVDSFFSLNSKDFKSMVYEIRNLESAIGKITYIIPSETKKNIKSKRSIYVSQLIQKNEIITKNNIKIIRPGFGLHPKFFEKILGKKVNKKLIQGTRFSLKYIK